MASFDNTPRDEKCMKHLQPSAICPCNKSVDELLTERYHKDDEVESMGSKLFNMAVDEAEGEDQTVMAVMVNTTTLSGDQDQHKYEYLAEEIMSSLFHLIDFADSFEIERFVIALNNSARSNGSKASIKLDNR
tara:strand:+ start:19727 stop:20125 length:399 start_codon:yes stop_codon:yes gene_type:complete